MELLHYRTLGKGPYLLILHGLYGMSDNWMSIARAVSEHFTVIIPDMRNHGRSFHSDVHTYASMAGDIEALSAHLGVKNFFLAGHSMGGKTAMRYALKHPENLNGLIIFDTAPVNYPDGNHHIMIHSHILGSMKSISPEQVRSREEALEQLGPMLPDMKLLNFLLKNLARRKDGTFYWRLNISVLFEHIDELAKGFSESHEPVSGFPVVFVRGMKSDYILPSHFPAMKKLFPDHELKNVNEAGHWMHQEQPSIITELLINFLR